MECTCHIPHKSWASNQERDNYATIEQWSQNIHDAWTSNRWNGGTVYIPLLIPAKGWAGSRYELENNLAIERWSRYFQMHCTKVIPTPCGC